MMMPQNMMGGPMPPNMGGMKESGDKTARSIFVGNIPYEATEEKLTELFAKAGPVISFRLVYDRESGKPKGYGFCEYNDPSTASSALRNLQNIEFNGRPLRIGPAAGEQNSAELALSNPAVGPPMESPYGDRVEPREAPEAISRAVASLPPEQMYELMKQMKLCIQNNPNEARNMLLQNPQLAYALLQAQIVMKIVDPKVAIAMLNRSNEQIPPAVPEGGAPASLIPSQSSAMTGGFMASSAPGPSSGPPVFTPSQQMNQSPQGAAPQASMYRQPPTRTTPAPVGPPQQSPPMTGAGPSGPYRFDPTNQPGGDWSRPPPPQQGGFSRPPMVLPPQQPGQGFPGGMGMPNLPPPQSLQGQLPPRSSPGQMQPTAAQAAAITRLQSPAFLAGRGEQEKTALIMQVLQLSDQQISMLPDDQRRSIMILKEQLGKQGSM